MLRRFKSYSRDFFFFLIFLPEIFLTNHLVVFLFNFSVSSFKKSDKFQIDFCFPSQFNKEVGIISLSLSQLFYFNLHVGFLYKAFCCFNYPYIYAKRVNILIINIFFLFYFLKLSFFFVINIISFRGIFCLIDYKEQGFNSISSYFMKQVNQVCFNIKWISGSFTNFRSFFVLIYNISLFIKKRIRVKIPFFFSFFRNFFSSFFSGGVRRLPNIVFFLDSLNNINSFLECFRLGLPIISVVDSHSQTYGVTFPLFSYLDKRAECFYLSVFRNAIERGYLKEILFFFSGRSFYLFSYLKSKSIYLKIFFFYF